MLELFYLEITKLCLFLIEKPLNISKLTLVVWQIKV